MIEAKTDAMARTRARHAITFKYHDLNTPLEFVALYKEGKKRSASFDRNQHLNEPAYLL